MTHSLNIVFRVAGDLRWLYLKINMSKMMANEMATPSHLSLTYVEDLYVDYLRDPASAPTDWQRYFAALKNGEPNDGPAMSSPAFHPYSVFNPPTARRNGRRDAVNRSWRICRNVLTH